MSYFLPPNYGNAINYQKLHIATNELVESRNGLKLLTVPLLAKGVSELFVEIVKDMMEMTIVVSPKTSELDWSIQFINPSILEDKYISAVSSDISGEDGRSIQPGVREEYLRNRFRNYMNRFQLFKQNNQKIDLSAQLQGNTITITEKGTHESL